jgi:hypothetical protein
MTDAHFWHRGGSSFSFGVGKEGLKLDGLLVSGVERLGVVSSSPENWIRALLHGAVWSFFEKTTTPWSGHTRTNKRTNERTSK